jgi:hypothetical protein
MNSLSNYISFFWNRYIPSSKKRVSLEAKRLAMFIYENYECSQHPELLDEIRKELLNKLKTESTFKLDNIVNTQKEMETLANVTNLLDESKILTKK